MNDGGYIAISPYNSNIIFATGNVYNSGYYIGVSHSTDDGSTWEHDTIALGSRGWAIAFDGVDSNKVYVGGDTNYSYPCVLTTTDLGATWSASHAGLAGTVNVLTTVPGVADLVYAGTNSGLFRSTDGGVNWSATALTRSVRTLVYDPVHPANLFAGTYGNGVYFSTDGGGTWAELNAGLTCNKVLMLALRPGAENTLYAGTEGGSVFRTTVTTGVSDFSPIANRQSPIAIFPNPCHDLTTVTFNSSLLSPHSALSIYDASGRLVRTLDVRTSSFALRTSDFSPGTYFIRVASPAQTLTTRLTVVK